MKEWTKQYHEAMRYIDDGLAKEKATAIEAPSENGEPLVVGLAERLQA